MLFPSVFLLFIESFFVSCANCFSLSSPKSSSVSATPAGQGPFLGFFVDYIIGLSFSPYFFLSHAHIEHIPRQLPTTNPFFTTLGLVAPLTVTVSGRALPFQNPHGRRNKPGLSSQLEPNSHHTQVSCLSTAFHIPYPAPYCKLLHR